MNKPFNGAVVAADADTLEPQLDRPVFWVSLIVLVAVTGLLLTYPEEGLVRIQQVHRWMTQDIGFVFLVSVFGIICGLLWIASSRFGSVVFGEEGEKPAYSTVSWFGMLFCAGIGSNLLYFGTTEWIGYFLSPPPLADVAAGTPGASDWAGAYSFLHWGIAAWSTYAVATLPIAYCMHVRKAQTMRVSTACETVLDRVPLPGLGKAMDILFVFGLVGGVGTSLGVGVPMLSAVASSLFGVERGMMLDTWIIVGLTAVFSYSVTAGLDKGIKLLSDINVVLAIILLGFVWAMGPSTFIINQALDSLAIMFQNFLQMSLRTDAGNGSTFVADNTVFFWAWWLAWAPFMGLFVARISRGRTIRQVVLGCVIGGSLACWTGFSILGHTVMELAQDPSSPIAELIATARTTSAAVDAPQVVVELLNAMPGAYVVTAIFFVLSFIFVATSLDSAAFTLASVASLDLRADAQPPRWHRLTWAFVLSATALSLMYLGGLQILQAASVVVGLPLLIVIGSMIWSFAEMLSADHGDDSKAST